VTAISGANGTIDVTWQGSGPTDSTNGLKIVKANALEVLTAADTDFNKSFEGLAAITRATSVHGLATSSVAAWSAAYADATGGRLDGIRLHQAADEMKKWGRRMTHAFADYAVIRDLIDSERSLLRHSGEGKMETDGDVKFGSTKITKTKRCEPGVFTGYQKGDILTWSLLPKADGSYSWPDGMESEDYSRIVFNMPTPMAMVCRARKGVVYFTGLDRHGV
jgi:hypothetical protein